MTPQERKRMNFDSIQSSVHKETREFTKTSNKVNNRKTLTKGLKKSSMKLQDSVKFTKQTITQVSNQKTSFSKKLNDIRKTYGNQGSRHKPGGLLATLPAK